jgi:endonuclease YncB( thermonuclease family)
MEDDSAWKMTKGPKLYTYRAKFVRAVDGDTFVFIVDLGFKVLKGETVRLKGIDVYERQTPKGKLATRFATRVLRRARGIRLITEKEKWGKFGRYVCSVHYLAKTQIYDLATELRKRGFEKPRRLD